MSKLGNEVEVAAFSSDVRADCAEGIVFCNLDVQNCDTWVKEGEARLQELQSAEV